MQLVVGLGNPGQKYAQTRHNVGFMAIDGLGLNFKSNPKLKALIAKKAELLVVKPQNFMNNSGPVVKAVWDYYQLGDDLTNLVVIHDDLDIALGGFKFQLGVGPKQHNGLNSIYQSFGSDEFWHARIGIENRYDHDFSGKDYVLENFLPEEIKIINELIPSVLTTIRQTPE